MRTIIYGKDDSERLWQHLRNIMMNGMQVMDENDVGSAIAAFCEHRTGVKTRPLAHGGMPHDMTLFLLPMSKSHPGVPLIDVFIGKHCVIGRNECVACADFNAALYEFGREDATTVLDDIHFHKIADATFLRQRFMHDGRKVMHYIGISLSSSGQQYLKTGVTTPL